MQREPVFSIKGLTALFKKGGEDALFVIEEGRATERVVKIGHRNGLAAEVLSGLSEAKRL